MWKRLEVSGWMWGLQKPFPSLCRSLVGWRLEEGLD